MRRNLRQARRFLDQAETILARLHQQSPEATISQRLAAVKAAGRSCCGKPSLWDRYPLGKADD